MKEITIEEKNYISGDGDIGLVQALGNNNINQSNQIFYGNTQNQGNSKFSNINMNTNININYVTPMLVFDKDQKKITNQKISYVSIGAPDLNLDLGKKNQTKKKIVQLPEIISKKTFKNEDLIANNLSIINNQKYYLPQLKQPGSK